MCSQCARLPTLQGLYLYATFPLPFHTTQTYNQSQRSNLAIANNAHLLQQIFFIQKKASPLKHPYNQTTKIINLVQLPWTSGSATILIKYSCETTNQIETHIININQSIHRSLSATPHQKSQGSKPPKRTPTHSP